MVGALAGSAAGTVVGARRPIRQPDGTSHGSPGRRRPARAASGRPRRRSARRQPACGGGEVRRPAVQQPGVQPPATTSGWASRQRRKSMLVVTPSTAVRPARGERAQRGGPVGGVRDHLGQHRVVVAADLVPSREPGVDAHARRPCGSCEARAPCRRSAGSRGPGPRRRSGPRWRARSGVMSSCANGSCSPAATRSCHSTRSRPVTSSVTGCSTCRRVFISMKKNSSGRSADTMNSTVPAPT